MEDEKKWWYVPVNKCVPLEIEVEANSPEEALEMVRSIINTEGYRNMEEDRLEKLGIQFYAVDAEQFYKHLDEAAVDEDPDNEIVAIN